MKLKSITLTLAVQTDTELEAHVELGVNDIALAQKAMRFLSKFDGECKTRVDIDHQLSTDVRNFVEEKEELVEDVRLFVYKDCLEVEFRRCHDTSIQHVTESFTLSDVLGGLRKLATSIEEVVE